MNTTEIRTEISQAESVLAKLQEMNDPRQSRMTLLREKRKEYLAPALVAADEEAKTNLQLLDGELAALVREAEDYPTAIAHVGTQLSRLRADLATAENEERRAAVIALIRAAIESDDEARLENLCRDLVTVTTRIRERNKGLSSAILALSNDQNKTAEYVRNLDMKMESRTEALLKGILHALSATDFWVNNDFVEVSKRQLNSALSSISGAKL